MAREVVDGYFVTIQKQLSTKREAKKACEDLVKQRLSDYGDPIP